MLPCDFLMSNYKNPYEAIGIVMECHAKGCVSVAQNCLSLEMGVFWACFKLCGPFNFIGIRHRSGFIRQDDFVGFQRDHRILGYC